MFNNVHLQQHKFGVFHLRSLKYSVLGNVFKF